MLLNKTTEKLKTGMETIVSMPVKQSFFMSLLACLLAVVAIIVAVKK